MIELIKQKWQEYVLEIIVIIMGILLAFALNNWHLERQNRTKEKTLIGQIHNEFLANKAQLEVVLDQNQRRMDKCSRIIQFFPIDPKESNLDTLGKILWGIGGRNTFNPSFATIEELQNTSSFEIIRDTRLRDILIGWPGLFDDYKEQEKNVIQHLDNYYHPFVMQSFPVMPLNMRDSRFDHRILSSYQFENMIKTRQSKLSSVCVGKPNMDMIIEAVDEILKLSYPSSSK